jgi:hypothetical protein
MYYAFIAGLPELNFQAGNNFYEPDLFLGRLAGVLSPEELKWAALLWFRKFHNGIRYFLGNSQHAENLPPEFPAGKFDPQNDSFQQIPEYLQSLVHWKKKYGENEGELVIGQKLQEFYFAQLLGSGNRFLKLWGESELNLLNYLAARRCKNMPDEKKDQLIAGNEYYNLLLDFQGNPKIINSEFTAAGRLEKIAENPNYFERELEMDKLRWDTIDTVNRFEYFTIDIILGYFQKLLLLERWKNIHQPQSVREPVEMAEKMVSAFRSNK